MSDELRRILAFKTTGDMAKSIYDTNNNGVVDAAENALSIDGVTVDMTGIADGYILYYDEATSSIKVKLDDAGGGGYTLGWNVGNYTGVTLTNISKPV